MPFLAVGVLSGALSGFWMTRQIATLAEAWAVSHAETVAGLVEAGVQWGDPVEAQDVVDRAGRLPDVADVVVVTSDQVVAATNPAWRRRRLDDLDEPDFRAEVRAALRDRTRSLDLSHHGGSLVDLTLPITVPLSPGGEIVPGAVMVHLRASAIHGVVGPVSRSAALSGAFGVGVSLAALFAALQRSVFEPLGAILRVLAARSAGDASRRIGLTGEDEIAGLGRTLDDRFDQEEQDAALRENAAALVAESEEFARAAMRELEVRRQIIERHVLVSETTPEGTITFVNQRLSRVSGYPREKLVGRSHRVLNSGVHAKGFWTTVFETIAREGMWSGEVCNRARDGSLYWVDATIAAVTDDDGVVQRYVSVSTDVTRQTSDAAANRALAEELRVERDRAKAAERAKSEFLATMSHEIRTPMNGILGFSELLGGTSLSDDQRGLVNTIRGSADSLLCIINDILDFSKIEAGRLTLERVPMDISEVVAQAAELLAPQAVAKGIDLVVDVPVALRARVLGDPVRFRQVVLNLMTNAVKFTERGRVTVRARRDGERDVRVEVRDTGIGIPADRIDSLFRRFEQVDGSMTRRFGGTGLGLAISKGLVEQMGGQVEVSSRLGVGSTFTVLLPVELVEEPEPTVPRYPATGWVIAARPEVCAVLVARATELDARASVREPGAFDGDHPAWVIVDGALPDPGAVGAALRARAPHARLVLLTRARVDAAVDGFDAVLCEPVARVAALASAIAPPHEPAQRGLTPPPAAMATPGLHGLRVLLAEDNPVNQMLAIRLLKGMGAVVRVANDGVEAVRAIEQGEPIDLVLMDCQMPEMDGYEATRRIRGTVGRRLPVIALTANAMAEDRERCFAAGMDDFLSKPFRAAELQAALARWALSGVG